MDIYERKLLEVICDFPIKIQKICILSLNTVSCIYVYSGQFLVSHLDLQMCSCNCFVVKTFHILKCSKCPQYVHSPFLNNKSQSKRWISEYISLEVFDAQVNRLFQHLVWCIIELGLCEWDLIRMDNPRILS